MEKKKKEEKEKKCSFDMLLSCFGSLEKVSNELISQNSFYTIPFPNTDNPILFIALVGFHHKKGSIIEFTFPPKEDIIENNPSISLLSKSNSPQKTLDEILNQITLYSLPDGCHFINEDNTFFLLQNFDYLLFGVSCYRQIKAEIEDEQENTRNCIQKAICIVSKFPLFGQIYSKLSMTIEAFFNQSTLKDKKIIEQLYDNIKNMKYDTLSINEIYYTFSVRKLCFFTKEKIWLLIKMILLEKKCIVFGRSSGEVCGFIFSLLSLFPGSLLFNLNFGENVMYFNKAMRMFGLPFNLGNKNYKIFPLISLFDIEDIDKNYQGYLLGTTNQVILKMSKLKIDCVVNLDTMKINTIDLNEKVVKITKAEKKIYTDILKKLKERNFKYEDEHWITNLNINSSNDFYGSDDNIREEFKQYFLELLITVALSIKISKNNSNEELNKSLDLIKINDLGDSDGEVESSAEKLKTKIIKEKEKITKKSIKKLLHSYNLDFIIHWSKTINFIVWNSQYDESISLRSQYIKKAHNVTIYYENGDSYTGSLIMGKRNGNGVYTYANIKFVYSGEWKNDKRNGTGSYTSEDNKVLFDGEWEDDMRSGNGQFVDNKVKYSGSFA